MTTTTADIDLRHILTTPVLDQGLRPICLALASSQIHQSARRCDPLAPDALWNHLEETGRASAGGAYPADIAAALAEVGQPELQHWPLQEGTGPTARPDGIDEREWFRADLANGLEQTALDSALDAGEIAMICIHVTDTFGAANGDAPVVDADTEAGQSLSGHAVICVGRRTVDGDVQYLVRNSWGPWWGDGGDGWLTAAFVAQHCYDVARITRTFSVD